MVDPGLLASDVIQTSAYFLLPPAVWVFLYLFAWRDPELARRTGFGRRTFWLLLPGSLLGTLSNLPIFPWNGNILAVNLGGAAVPVALSLLFLARNAPDPTHRVATYLGGLAVVSGGMLAIELAVPPGPLALAGYAVALAAPPLVLVWRGRSIGDGRGRAARLTGVMLGLTSAVLGITFAFTSTVPGVGIVSEFPFYLLGPALAGVVAVVAVASGNYPITELLN